MTDKFQAWMLALAKRDELMIMLAMIAGAVVLAWVLNDYLPPPKWRPIIRRMFYIGGAWLYLFTIYVSIKAMYFN